MVTDRRLLIGPRHVAVKLANCARLPAQMIHKEVGGYCPNLDANAAAAYGSGHPPMAAHAEQQLQQPSAHPGVTHWSVDGKVTAFTQGIPQAPQQSEDGGAGQCKVASFPAPGVQPSPMESSGGLQQCHAGATGEGGGRGTGQWTTAMLPVAGGPGVGRADGDGAGGGYGGVQPSMAPPKSSKHQLPRFWQSDEEQARASAAAGGSSVEQASFVGGPAPVRGEGLHGWQGGGVHVNGQVPQASMSQAFQAPQVYPPQQGSADFWAPAHGGSHDGQQTFMGPRPDAQVQKWAAGVLRHGDQQGRSGSMPEGQHEGAAQIQQVRMEGNDGPVCNHGIASICRVCNSEGPDKGRLFYVCKLHPSCDYHQWADEPEPPRMPVPEEAMEEEREAPPADLQAAPSCYCPQPTVTRKCRKGENQGKWFFTCAKGKNSGCPYFAWAHEELKPVGPKCRCGLMSRCATVKKDGPNKGKAFFCCSKEKGTGCEFFQWNEQQAGRGGVATPMRGNNRGCGGGGGGGGIGGGVGGHGVYGVDQGAFPAHDGGMGYGGGHVYGGMARAQHAGGGERSQQEFHGGVPGAAGRYGPY